MDQCFDKWLEEGKITRSAYLYLSGESAEHLILPDEDGRLKISVLISTYKRPAYLIRLLNSVKSQQYNNCEIIIVDDASNDETGEVVNRYKAENPDLNINYLVNGHNSGASESRRRAYLEASGDIIIFVDDDDYYIEPSYFSMLSELYDKYPDCTMTIAAALQHVERVDRYEFLCLNTPVILNNREYLNDFDGKFKLPLLFTVSLRGAYLKSIHYEDLLCFNHTSLQLFGLLGKGKVHTIYQAIGMRQIHTGNMTGNTTPEFIIANLESKEDIFQRAKKKKLLDDPKEWHYRNLTGPAGYHFARNQKRTREDKLIWKWMKDHLEIKEFYQFVIRIVKSRIRRR